MDLPDFVVLTGVNGAGKSHLLEAIDNGAIRIDNITPNNQTRPIRRFDWNTLIPQDTGAFAPSQLSHERFALWTQFSQSAEAHRQGLLQALQQS
ncbi:MAG: ATP-binding protein, partial [Janthinobacterium lividum]